MSRKNYHTTRMLPRGSPDTGTSQGQTLHLASSLCDRCILLSVLLRGLLIHSGRLGLRHEILLGVILEVIIHISKCCLFRNTTYGSRLECLALTEEYLGVCMCLRLILTREVQIDIRLLVSVESKECLEWYIVSFLYKRCSTIRTVSVRHITSAHSRIRLYKL